MKMPRLIASVAVAAAGLCVQVNGQCDPFPPSLVAWWPLDGDAMDIVGRHDGAFTGGMFIDGVLGEALSVTGPGQGVEVPHDDALDPFLEGGGTQEFFVDFWVRVSSVAGETHLLGMRPGCSTGIDYQFVIQGEAYVLGADPGHGVATANGTAIPDVWAHVAAGHGPGGWQIFLNGVDAKDFEVGVPGSSATPPLMIGRAGTCAGVVPQDIDEVHFWNRVLLPCEVAALYESGPYAVCPCAAADFNLNDAVDIADMLTILAEWGSDACPYDLDGSGAVDIADLLIVLATWGPCD